MQPEINGRVLNSVILYVRKHRPQDLPRLLEGLQADVISDQHEWVSAEVRDQVFQRAEAIFGRTDILEEIGKEVFSLHALGIVEWLLRLDPDLTNLFRPGTKYTSLFTTVAEIKVRQLRAKELAVERTEARITRGSCFYLRGLLLAILDLFERKGYKLTETHCSVPIWDKGVLDGCRFQLRQGRVWRLRTAPGQEEDLGPVSPDGTFSYGGTTYGAPACRYRLQWSGGPGWWRRWKNRLTLRRQWMENMQQHLIQEYQLVEERNRQLRQNTSLMKSLLEQKSDLTRTLEQKVTNRTLELEDLVKQLQELDEMKSYFLSLTSHELRTPLTIIKGALSLLLAEGEHLTPERYRRYLLMARTNADHLQLLIANLLDLSRLESGQMKLELEDVDLIRLLRESAEEFRDLADRRELSVKADLPPVLPNVAADYARLKQIINNLLSNAIKFTPPKGEIRLSVESSAEHVLIRVSDSGIGIEPWESEKIFRKFQQSERSLTRESSGIGLGLAIVKELVELHEGRVWVESEKGKGAQFFVQLPISGPKDSAHFVRREARLNEEPPMILESH